MPTPRQYASHADRQAAYRQRCAGKQLMPRPAPPVPGYRRWDALLTHAESLLDRIADEMVAYADERSEAWQDSERGAWFSERLEAIEEMRALLHDLPPSPTR